MTKKARNARRNPAQGALQAPRDPLAERVRATDKDTASLVEQLPYWEILHDAVFLTDGRAEVGFELTPLNSEVMDEPAQVLLHRGLKSLLRGGVKDGQRLRLYVRVEDGSISELEDYRRHVTAQEDILTYLGTQAYELFRAWEEARELYRYRYFLSFPVGTPRLGYRGGGGFFSFLQDLIPALKQGTHISFTSREMEEFLRDTLSPAVERMKQHLALAGIEHRRLTGHELYGVIFRYLNPGSEPSLHYTPTFDYLPTRLTKQEEAARRATLRSRLVRSTVDNRHLHFLRLGHYYVAALKMVDIPAETWFGMLHPLLTAGGKPKWAVMDFTRLTPARAEGILRNRFRDYYRTAEQQDIPDIGAEEGAREVAEYIRHIRRSGEGIYLVSAVFLLMDTDLNILEDKVRDFLVTSSALEGQPFMRLHRGVFSTFLEALPFSGLALSRPRMYPETQAAHLWLWGGPWRHQAPRPVEIYITRYNTPVSLDPWDPRLPNYNAIIVGETGSGKSFLVQHRLTEVLKMKDTVAVAIDRHQYSYDGLYTALEEKGVAAKIHYGPSSPTVINPFDLPEGQNEPDDLKLLQLESLFRLMAPPGGMYDPAHEEAVLRAAILQTYRNATTEVQDPEGNWVPRYRGATISDLIRNLREINRVADHMPTDHEREIASSLAARLEKWSRKTALGKIFDGESTARLSPHLRFLYVIIEPVEGMDEFFQVAALNLIQLVWNFVSNNPHPQRVVVLEEAWNLLANPHGSRIIYEMFRRGRTLGISTWAVSQALEDFTAEHARAVSMNAARFFILRGGTPPELVSEVTGMPMALASAKTTLVRVQRRFTEALTWARYGEQGEGGVIRVLADPVRYWLFTTHPLEREKRRQLAKELGSTLRAVQKLREET